MNTVRVGDIVEVIKLDTSRMTAHEDQRILRFIFAAISRLNSMGLFQLKRELLEVTKLNTIDLPIDFHSYRRVAVIKGDKLLALSQNERINIALPLNGCGNEIRSNQCCHGDEYSFYPAESYQNGHYHDSGRSGGSSVGQMRLDYERGQFVLSGVSATHLLLEYYSLLPKNCLDVNYKVDARLQDAIMTYVIQKLHDPSLNKRYDVNAYQVAKANFEEEAYRTHAAIYPIGIEDIQEAMLNAYKQSIKGISGY